MNNVTNLFQKSLICEFFLLYANGKSVSQAKNTATRPKANLLFLIYVFKSQLASVLCN